MKKRLLFGLPLVGLALLTVSCDEKTNQSSVTVAEDALARITLDSSAMKTAYYIGEEIDFTGLKVTAVYENGETKEVTDYTYDESTFDSSEKGVCFVKIIYTEKGVTKTRNVQVDVKSILDDRVYLIGLTCEGAKSDYHYQEQLDLSNLKVTAYYSDESKKELNSNEYTIDSSAFNANMRGNYEIVIKYSETYSQAGTTTTATRDAETCFFANVILNMESISFASGTSTYYQYGGVSTSDWKIKVTYKEGVSEEISTGFTTDIQQAFADSTVATSKDINISYTYNGVTCTTKRRCMIREAKQIALFGALETKNDIQTEDYQINTTYTLLKGYKVVENRQECDDQIFLKCISLDGVGSKEENSIRINSSNTTKMQFCVSSEEGTSFGLYDSNGNAVFTSVAPSEVTRYTVTGLKEGTYYIWSEGGLNVYYIATFE